MLYSGNYAQSSLFVQELSYQKTANILSCIKIDKTSVENCITAIQKNEEIQQVFNNNAPTSVVITDITEVSNLIYRMKYKLTYFQTNNRSICEGTMGDVILDLKWNAGVLDQNDVYKINYPGRSTINNFEEFSNSLQIVEIYTVQLYPKLLTYNA